MGLRQQRLRLNGAIQPETTDIITSSATASRSGKALSIAGIGGGAAQEDAVMWARLAGPVNPGESTLFLDRNGGLLDILPESKILIDVGDYQHDYKAITNASVVNNQINLPSPLTYGHSAGDLVGILTPGEGVRTSWLGLGVGTTSGDAARNVATFNRFSQHQGLAEQAGGAVILFDGGVYINDKLKVKGDYVSLRGMTEIAPGCGVVAHASMTWPSDLSGAMISFQDINGVTPTFANPAGVGCWIQMEYMALYGVQNIDGSNGISDSIGVVGLADGGLVNSIKYRYFKGPGAWCMGGRGLMLSNMQPDYCQYGFTTWANGWELINLNSTATNVVGEPHSQLRVIGGSGGAAIGSDYETQAYPGCFVSIEGDASGILIENVRCSGLQGAADGTPGTIINVDSTGPAGADGCYYEIVNFKCNQSDPVLKVLRDVQRNFSIRAMYLHVDPKGIYGRTLNARTVSQSQVLYGSNQIAGVISGTPQPQAAGTLG